jgi:peptide subunit release factor 1 (eRF1)
MKKKDFNYIAGLEKAIKKKYGEEAVENPAKFWDKEKEKDYIQQLEEFVEKQKKSECAVAVENVDGVLVSRKLLNKEGIFNCPTCNKKLKTINDDIYFTKFDCCEICYIKYVEGREKRWVDGWRPKNVTKSS